MTIKTYRVREGRTFGASGQYAPGDVVRLEEKEADAFLDKLRLVDEPLEGVPPAPSELKNDLGAVIPEDLKLTSEETQAESGEPSDGINLQESNLDLSAESNEPSDESQPAEKKNKSGPKPKTKAK